MGSVCTMVNGTGFILSGSQETGVTRVTVTLLETIKGVMCAQRLHVQTKTLSQDKIIDEKIPFVDQ